MSVMPAPIPHDFGGLRRFHCRFWTDGGILADAFDCWYFPDEPKGQRFVPVRPMTRGRRAALVGWRMTIHPLNEDIEKIEKSAPPI